MQSTSSIFWGTPLASSSKISEVVGRLTDGGKHGNDFYAVTSVTFIIQLIDCPHALN